MYALAKRTTRVLSLGSSLQLAGCCPAGSNARPNKVCSGKGDDYSTTIRSIRSSSSTTTTARSMYLDFAGTGPRSTCHVSHRCRCKPWTQIITDHRHSVVSPPSTIRKDHEYNSCLPKGLPKSDMVYCGRPSSACHACRKVAGKASLTLKAFAGFLKDHSVGLTICFNAASVTGKDHVAASVEEKASYARDIRISTPSCFGTRLLPPFSESRRSSLRDPPVHPRQFGLGTV